MKHPNMKRESKNKCWSKKIAFNFEIYKTAEFYVVIFLYLCFVIAQVWAEETLYKIHPKSHDTYSQSFFYEILSENCLYFGHKVLSLAWAYFTKYQKMIRNITNLLRDYNNTGINLTICPPHVYRYQMIKQNEIFHMSEYT